MSSFLRRFFLSKQVMEDSGKRKDEVTLILPSVKCEAVNLLITLVTTGEGLMREKTRRDISDVWALLNIDRIDFNSLGMIKLDSGIPDKDAGADRQEGRPEVIDLVNDEDFDEADISPPLVKTETVDEIEKPLVQTVGKDKGRKKIEKNVENKVPENEREKHSEAGRTLNELPKPKRRGRNSKSMKIRPDVESVQGMAIGNLQVGKAISSNKSKCLSSTLSEDIDKNPPISISKDNSAKKDRVCGLAKQSSEQLLQSLLPNINISKASDESQDKEVSLCSQSQKKSIAHQPHISITKQVRVPAVTPPLKKPQIRGPTAVREIKKNNSRDDVSVSLSVNLNPEETNEEARNEDNNPGNVPEAEKNISQDEQNPSQEDIQSNQSVSVSGKPKIVVEGLDGFDVEIKYEMENSDQPVYNMDHQDEREDDNIDYPPILNSVKKRKIPEDLESEDGFKRRRSTRLKATESSEGAKPKEQGKKNERRSFESVERAAKRISDAKPSCVVCGLGLNMKDMLAVKEHYSKCLYDNDNIYPTFLSPGVGNTATDGSPLDDQGLKYRCAVKGCLLNMKPGNRGLLSYRHYAIHMSKDHGYLEKVIESDPREGMAEILDALKKSGHFNPGIVQCRISGCDKIFNRDSKRDLKVHYATSHLKKHFPVREETGLSPGFCKEENKCRCEKCEESGKKILIMAGLDDTIRHLVITHDGLKTILENIIKEPQMLMIFNDIYGD